MISRRDVLGLPLMGAASAQAAGSRKLRIVVAGGHPGDPEYGCGGAVARYTDLGHRVTLLYLNRGERGIPKRPFAEAGAIRTTEARAACEILKARPLFAKQEDGGSVIDERHYDEFHQLLAAEDPDLVFTQWPIDNHRDHRAISMLVYDAWLRMGRKFALYYYEVSNGEDTLQFSPTHYADITIAAARKRAACYAHASQSPDKFYALQEQVTRFRGIESGHEQAEGYIRHVQSPDFELPLL